MRKSKQKNLILDIINQSNNHPSAFDIYEISKKSIPNISLGTIYRNLNKLADENQIIRIKTPDNIDKFDHSKHKHAHFICLNCHKIYDIDKSLKEEVMIDDHKITDYDISFKGICKECQSK